MKCHQPRLTPAWFRWKGPRNGGPRKGRGSLPGVTPKQKDQEGRGCLGWSDLLGDGREKPSGMHH